MDAPLENHSTQDNVQKEQQQQHQSDTAKAPLRPRPRKICKPKPVKKKRKSPKISSEIWDHFTKPKDQDPEDPRAFCNYCDKSYASDSKSHGTSTLWNHFRLCPKSPYRVEDKKQKILSFEPNGTNGSLKAVAFSPQDCRKALGNMVILDELPFKKVEGEGFKMFVRALQPKFFVPTRITVAKDCWDIYTEEKSKLKELLKSQRVCLTTDAWTSVQNLNYMCLTAHWVNSAWKLQKRVINFCLIPNHKGETIGETIEWCLRDWGIDGIFTITLDNARSNNGAVKYLKRRTKDWKGTVLGHEFLHVRCCAHIVNLIVREGLDEHDETIQKIRKAVKFVRSSPSRLETFKKCVAKEQIDSKSLLSLDVETRWNSTYLMLESAEKFERAFERLAREDSKYFLYFSGYEEEVVDGGEIGSRRLKGKAKMDNPPDEDDWNKARCFIKFLKLFYGVTLKFSGSLHVTSNAFFHELVAINTLLEKMVKGDNVELRVMAGKMKTKFDKYWDYLTKLNMLLFIAVVLDPRYKLKYISFWFEKMYGGDKGSDLTRKVESTLSQLYESYRIQYGNVASVSGAGAANHSNGATSNAIGIEESEENYSDFVKSQFKFHIMTEESMENKSEVGKYLAESCEGADDSSFNILDWSKTNSTRYPILSSIAKDVLAIPISTVASESAFSTGGRILDPFRSSLSPKMVQALVCTQNWLRSRIIASNVGEEIDDAAIYEAIDKELMVASTTGGITITEAIDI